MNNIIPLFPEAVNENFSPVKVAREERGYNERVELITGQKGVIKGRTLPHIDRRNGCVADQHFEVLLEGDTTLTNMVHWSFIYDE